MSLHLHRVALVLVMVLLAGCSAPSASVSAPSTSTGGATGAPSGGSSIGDIVPESVNNANGGGGGVVGNTPPTIPSFSADKTTGDNGGAFVVIFTGTIFDANAEKDIASIKVTATGPSNITSAAHAIVWNQLNSTEPANFSADGFKVWDATTHDGQVQFRYRQTFAAFTPSGAYAFVATGTDASSATGLAAPVTITLTKFSSITLAAGPVDATGAVLSGASWGGWNAVPGATNVGSTNYLKLVNDGDQPNVRVVLDFTDASFKGVNDSTVTIPISNNTQFAWFEDTTPATTSPTEQAMSFGSVSPDGSVTLTFTAKGDIIYVAYRLVQLPAVLDKQSYTAAFTVTEL